VHLGETEEDTYAGDTPDDLRRVEEAMKAGSLNPRYINQK
jgi:hypothetical protein